MPLDRKTVTDHADQLVAGGMIPQAIMEYRRLLRELPGDIVLTNRIGDLYVQAGRNEEAAATFKVLALHLQKDQQDKKAIALLKRLLRLTPGDEEAGQQLVELLHASGSPREAAAVHLQLSTHFESLGDRERALEQLCHCVEADPSNLVQRALLARRYREGGQTEKAAGHFLDAAEGLALQQRFEEARELAGQAASLTTGPRLLLTQARIEVLAGQPGHAMTFLRAALANHPGNPGILENLAEVQIQAGQPAEGMALLRQLRQPTERILPLCENALHDLAEAGRLRLALRLFRPMARTLAARGSGPAVTAVLKSAFKGHQHVVLWLIHAEVALEGEQRDEALNALRQAFLLAEERTSRILSRAIHHKIEELEGRHRTSGQIIVEQAQQMTMMIPLASAKRVNTQAKLQLERKEDEAHSQVKLGNLQGAQSLFQEIIQSEPTQVTAIKGLVNLWISSGQVHKAQAQCISSAQALTFLGRKQEARQLLDLAEGFMAGSTHGPRKMLGL